MASIAHELTVDHLDSSFLSVGNHGTGLIVDLLRGIVTRDIEHGVSSLFIDRTVIVHKLDIGQSQLIAEFVVKVNVKRSQLMATQNGEYQYQE